MDPAKSTDAIKPDAVDGQVFQESGETNEVMNSQVLPETQGSEYSETPPTAHSIEAGSRVETSGSAAVSTGDLLARLGDLESGWNQRMEGIQDGINALSEKLAFIPPQVRNLGLKFEAVASSAWDSKYRSLLLTLLNLYDLARQMILADSNNRPVEVIFTQIQQILEGNGLKEISASENFDPSSHCAIQVVPTTDSARDGKISRLLRPGFSAGGRVLRFAEVEIWKLQTLPVPAVGQERSVQGLDAETPRPSGAELSERLAP